MNRRVCLLRVNVTLVGQLVVLKSVCMFGQSIGDVVPKVLCLPLADQGVAMVICSVPHLTTVTLSESQGLTFALRASAGAKPESIAVPFMMTYRLYNCRYEYRPKRPGV